MSAMKTLGQPIGRLRTALPLALCILTVVGLASTTNLAFRGNEGVRTQSAVSSLVTDPSPAMFPIKLTLPFQSSISRPGSNQLEETLRHAVPEGSGSTAGSPNSAPAIASYSASQSATTFLAATPPTAGSDYPNKFVTFANDTLNPGSGGLTTSLVDEPSVANKDNIVFYTGNWYAARSQDGGITWRNVDPYADMPNFCCDQDVIYVPNSGVFVWNRLGINPLSPSGPNSIRLGISSDALTWSFYDIHPYNLNSAWTSWMFDFPSLAFSNTYLYLTANIFSGGLFQGSVILRLALNVLTNGQSLSFQQYYFQPDICTPSTGNCTFAPVQGATTTMYWGSHVKCGPSSSSQCIRLYSWNESSDKSSISSKDILIPQFSPTSRGDARCPSPDGGDICVRADDALLSGWVAKDVVGFLWNVKQGGVFPYPYVDVVRLNETTKTLLDSPSLSSSNFAFIYGSASPNGRGDLGLVAFCSGATSGNCRYPTLSVGIDDNVSSTPPPWELHIVSSSTNGPATSCFDGTANACWGDYIRVRPFSGNANLWIVSGYVLQGGRAAQNVIPKLVVFGRGRDGPSLTLGFSIQGGGSGSSSPLLSYTFNGTRRAVRLTTSPTLYFVDYDTAWNATSSLSSLSSGERWRTNQTTSGIAISSRAETLVYYHQYNVTFDYRVIGGGTGYSSPNVTLTQFNITGSIIAKGSFWADAGTPWTMPNLLQGSSTSERWFSSDPTNGIVTAPADNMVTYYRQFFLTVTGSSGTDNGQAWYNAGSSTSATSQGIYGRNSGVGLRVASITVDSGALTTVTPTTGIVSVPVLMDSAHKVQFSSVTQYQISLDSGAVSSLNTITSPTVLGDNYWYDSGSPVSIVLNGVWGRSQGTGNRLISYALNGGPHTGVYTIATVPVLTLPTITGPQSITTDTVIQYLLTFTAPTESLVSIGGSPTADNWYDSGLVASIDLNSVWNVVNRQSRERLTGYTIDGTLTIVKASSGTFIIEVTMNISHSFIAISVTQYYLDLSGGDTIAYSTLSPTGDDWFDSGTKTSISSNYVWGLASSQSRNNLVSYTLDGNIIAVPRSGSRVFSTPSILFASFHSIRFNSLLQYFLIDNLSPNSVSHLTSSPTGDSWYDNETIVSIVLNKVWDVTQDQSRENLVSYTIDSVTTMVARTSSGVVAIPFIQMSSRHAMLESFVTQYYISVTGATASGSQTGDGWFDSGSLFTVEATYSRAYIASLSYHVYVVSAGFQILANTTVSSALWTNSSGTLEFKASHADLTVYIPTGLNLVPTRVLDDGSPLSFSYSTATGLLSFRGSSSFQIDFVPPSRGSSPGFPGWGFYLAAAGVALASGIISTLVLRGLRNRVRRTPSVPERTI